MQKCLSCGADIRYIATGPQKSIACDCEKLSFVTDNGRVVSGYLIHNCKKNEDENGKTEKD